MYKDIEVFILTFDRLKFLKESVQSILNQTIKVKLTIVDNAGTDGTEEYVKALMNEYDNVHYYKQPIHVTFEENFKTARKLATSKYVMFFHDDDLCHPQYLEYALKVINKFENVDLICSLLTQFNDNDVPEHKHLDSVKYSVFKDKLDFATHSYTAIFSDCTSIMFPSVIYKTENIKDLDFDHKTYGKIGDKPYVISAMKDGVCVQLREKEFLKYRVHTGQDSLNNSNDPSVENVINHNKFFGNIMSKKFISKLKYDVFSPKWLFILNNMREKIDEKEKKNIVKDAYKMGGCNLYCYLSTSSPIRFLFKGINKKLVKKFIKADKKIKEETLCLNENEG